MEKIVQKFMKNYVILAETNIIDRQLRLYVQAKELSHCKTLYMLNRDLLIFTALA